MDLDRFQRVLQRMEESGSPSQFQSAGCSEGEVAALEARYGLRLPQAYILYLRLMGNKSWYLFTRHHLEVSYRDVLAMTANQRQVWTECNAEDGSGPPPEFDLPLDALLIANQLGDQFEFVRCHGQEDSPVWYFNQWEWQVRQSNPSVLAWL